MKRALTRHNEDHIPVTAPPAARRRRAVQDVLDDLTANERTTLERAAARDAWECLPASDRAQLAAAIDLARPATYGHGLAEAGWQELLAALGRWLNAQAPAAGRSET